MANALQGTNNPGDDAMGEELSDEDYGRRWAEENRACLTEIRTGFAFGSSVHAAVRGFYTGPHQSEPEAYSELGRAVRAVHAAVPPLKGVAAKQGGGGR